MIRLKLYNNILVNVEVEGTLFTEQSTLKVEIFHLGRFRKKNTVVTFIQGDNLEEESSTGYNRRFTGVWESSTHSQDYVTTPWNVRISLLDSDGNAHYVTEYKEFFVFEPPYEGEALSTTLDIVATEQNPEVSGDNS